MSRNESEYGKRFARRDQKDERRADRIMEDEGSGRVSDDSSEPVFSYPQNTVDELRQRAVQATAEAKHDWRQQGVWVRCESCKNSHGFFVGTKKILIGITQDGMPILRDL